MGQGSFFSDEAKRRAAAAVKAAEAQTSAEVVVAVRDRSGDYRAADYHAGFIATALVVGAMVVMQKGFRLGDMAIDGVLAFAAGALLAANVALLRRRLVGRRTLVNNTVKAAQAAFYELGVSRTSGRNGVLVFVSAFEQACAVVPDIGIDPTKLGEEYAQACRRLEMATQKLDLDAFLAAVEDLGAALGSTMPRAADDINELPDEVQ